MTLKSAGIYIIAVGLVGLAITAAVLGVSGLELCLDRGQGTKG